MNPPPQHAYSDRQGVSCDPANDSSARHLVEAPIEPGKRLLIIEGGCGALLARHAPGFEEALCQNSLFPNHASSLKTLADQGLSRAACVLGDLPCAVIEGMDGGLPPASPCFPPGHFDQIVYRLSRGTASLNAALLESFSLLRMGGSLWVAGHNREGIKSFAKRAEGLFGNMEIAAIKASSRLLRFRKLSEGPIHPMEDPQYFKPLRHFIGLSDGKQIEYLTKPGIFSYRETDSGTALLAGHLPSCRALKVLDLGCGSGVLSLGAIHLGASAVMAVDMNAIAVACAEANFNTGDLPGKALCTFLADGVEETFDIILSNPPFHSGGEADFSLPGRILDAAKARLAEGGTLLLVANRFLDYPREGRERFSKVEVVAGDKGFLVYRMTL